MTVGPAAETSNEPPRVTLSSFELVDAAGISFRQLDYWTRAKWLTPVRPVRGSGDRRDYYPAEVRVARLLSVLVPLHANRGGGVSLVDDEAFAKAIELARAGGKALTWIEPAPGVRLDLHRICTDRVVRL